jgi:hypothetical protein
MKGNISIPLNYVDSFFFACMGVIFRLLTERGSSIEFLTCNWTWKPEGVPAYRQAGDTENLQFFSGIFAKP